ncbi:histidine triad nucleotide-binding protein [Parathalassolituus penaei]|uniref:Histidine triad nucleotide-binding protein n=1 Tax=Parathalassolituus penaei TaxID=2997323 RepID=A0A9X3ISL3_9GAMM|nr:histidine triad nucleotide-binding protein [Parathalassolituus penaei]MCY0965004.1 histidine triad nucleotide-binding protein [Parathalassolituus penaei]
MSDCIFCKIVAGQIPASKVYEDSDFLAFRDIAPKADTHLLLIPKRHIVNLNDINAADEALLGRLLLTIPNIAAAEGLAGYRTITNTGVEGGQEVFHMHFHILGGDQLPGF